MTRPDGTGGPQKIAEGIDVVAHGTVMAMHVNHQDTDLGIFELIAGSLHGVALFACLHCTEDAPVEYYDSLAGYFREALEQARVKVAAAEGKGATTQ